MRGSVLGVCAGACLCAAFSASAQTGQLPLTSAAGYPPQAAYPSPFRCANFTHNSDGSWSPLRAVTVRSGNARAKLEPGAAFKTGMTFAGVDVAAVLNRRCTAR